MRLSKRFAHTFAALTFAVTAAVPSQAQDASDAFASVLCMKAAPGKATAFTDLQRETRPALQAMVDNTGLRSWYLARNWVPGAGAEADCYFQLISVHNSFPDLGATIEAMGRAWEQSKLPMTLPEYFAKRNAISHIVRREIW